MKSNLFFFFLPLFGFLDVFVVLWQLLLFHPDEPVLVHDAVEALPHVGLAAAVLVAGVGLQTLKGQLLFVLKTKKIPDI